WRDTEEEHAALVARRRKLNEKLRDEKRRHPTPPEAAEIRGPEEKVLRVTRRHPRLILLESLLNHLSDERRSGVSGRFPYRLGQLLRPLGLDAKLAELNGVVACETERVLARQAKELRERNGQAFESLAAQTARFLDSLHGTGRVSDYVNVFLAAAWLAN